MVCILWGYEHIHYTVQYTITPLGEGPFREGDIELYTTLIVYNSIRTKEIDDTRACYTPA